MVFCKILKFSFFTLFRDFAYIINFSAKFHSLAESALKMDMATFVLAIWLSYFLHPRPFVLLYFYFSIRQMQFFFNKITFISFPGRSKKLVLLEKSTNLGLSNKNVNISENFAKT